MSFRSRLHEYRALLQVVALSQEQQLSSADVVHHAVLGGVVQLFQDKYKPTTKQFLPSVKCIYFLCECISEGLFAPTLSFTVENDVSRYTPISECMGRDLFTAVVLLFPDCFLDADELLGEVSDEESENHCHGSPIDFTLAEEDGQPVTPVSQKCSTSCPRSPQNSRRVPHQTNPNYNSSSHEHLGTSPSAALGQSVSLNSSVRHSSTVEVDLYSLHFLRSQIALDFLSCLNDSLHDAQVRLQRIQFVHQPDNGKKTKGSAVSGSKGELATIDNVIKWLLKVKMLLLGCLCAAGSAYQHMKRPATPVLHAGAVQPLSVNADGDLGGAPNEENPRKRFIEIMEPSEEFTDPVEFCEWPPNNEEMNLWYDRRLNSVCSFYTEDRWREAPKTFEGYLNLLKLVSREGSDSVNESKVSFMLSKGDTGKGAMFLNALPSRPTLLALPLAPVQGGELRFLPHAPFMVDCSVPSPFMKLLKQLSQRKFTDTQIRTDASALFTTPYKDLNPSLINLVENYLRDENNMVQLLDKNAILLARLVIWAKASPEESADRQSTRFSAVVEPFVLLKATFNVSVAQYMREMVSQKAIRRELWTKWLFHIKDHICNLEAAEADKFLSMHVKTICAIVDFSLVQCSWELDEEESKAFAVLRQLVK